jgi:NDP-sugar pyrophosphorylase family protein
MNCLPADFLKNNVKFFLLAGGYGTRTLPLSTIKPKPAFPLDGTPLIRIMLEQLFSMGLRSGFVNLHHLPDIIRTCVNESISCVTDGTSPDIRFFYEDTLSGSKILKEAARHLEDDQLLLVVNGDIFLDIPIMAMIHTLFSDPSDDNHHDNHQDNHHDIHDNNHYNRFPMNSEIDGCILVRPNKERDNKYKAILSESHSGVPLFAGRNVLTGCASSLLESSLLYTGVALFNKNVLSAIEDINFFDSLERNNFSIGTTTYDGLWLDIGDPQSYLDSNFKYKSHIGNTSDLSQNSLSENVSISQDSTVEHSIIWENSEIKNNSIIKNCIVTGNVLLDRANFQDEIIGAAGKMGALS